MKAHCSWCDAAVPMMARTCPECGAVNPARRTMLGLIAAAGVLVPAVIIAIYAATRWERPLISADGPADVVLPSQSIAGSDADYNWLQTAMKACDDKAASEPSMMHLLVVPIAFDAKDLEQRRRQAINRIGNAIVLSSNDALNALRDKTIAISNEEYTFGIRDEKTQAVRKWGRSSGVKWLSAPGGDDTALFTLQYKPRDKGRNDNWGNPIVHQKGNCYWINAAFEE